MRRWKEEGKTRLKKDCEAEGSHRGGQSKAIIQKLHNAVRVQWLKCLPQALTQDFSQTLSTSWLNQTVNKRKWLSETKRRAPGTLYSNEKCSRIGAMRFGHPVELCYHSTKCLRAHQRLMKLEFRHNTEVFSV